MLFERFMNLYSSKHLKTFIKAGSIFQTGLYFQSNSMLSISKQDFYYFEAFEAFRLLIPKLVVFRSRLIIIISSTTS